MIKKSSWATPSANKMTQYKMYLQRILNDIMHKEEATELYHPI